MSKQDLLLTPGELKEKLGKMWRDPTGKAGIIAGVVAKAQLAKVKQHYEQKKLEIENQTIKVVLEAIEKHGLDKVLALRDKRRNAYSVIADLNDPFEVRGKGRGV